LGYPGFFLSFEGVDGCGKTTQLERLAERLRASGRDPVLAQEPGGTRVGREIRRVLLDARSADLRPIPELLLYFASRAQNIAEVIRPALEQGRIVLADRFTDATVAYQGYGRELGIETVRAIEAVACAGLKPDLTLWLDLDPELSVARALARRPAAGEADESRMERETFDFHRRVRQGYEELWQAEPERIRRVDASGTVEEVERSVEAALGGRLPSI
jgi:dTMP kinase